jgi:sarcosine oxidase
MGAHDAIVIGLGAHGSAAALALARRGLTVLGIEAGQHGHELGSSGGRSRMIRRAYFEHPAYIPLLAAARDGWERLGDEIDDTIVEPTGGLYLGPLDGDIVAGSIASAREQGVDHEVVDADEIRRRWPIFQVDESVGGLYDPGAGMIRPERAIEAQLGAAERRGADLRFGERALEWRPAGRGGGLDVETDAGIHATGHLIIAAGAWTGAFVPDLRLPVEVERMPVFWFEPGAAVGRPEIGRLPLWLFDTSFDGVFYGFPYDGDLGLKVSRHHSGDLVDPGIIDRGERPSDVERIRLFTRRHMPSIATAPVRGSTVCLYANTPDFHFIVDTHPTVPGVAFASACSGHGFKFAPVIGEILADLAVDGATVHPIDLFRADRFVRR